MNLYSVQLKRCTCSLFFNLLTTGLYENSKPDVVAKAFFSVHMPIAFVANMIQILVIRYALFPKPF